jgi:hypothetical protein
MVFKIKKRFIVIHLPENARKEWDDVRFSLDIQFKRILIAEKYSSTLN